MVQGKKLGQVHRPFTSTSYWSMFCVSRLQVARLTWYRQARLLRSQIARTVATPEWRARSLEIAQVKMLVHVDKRRCRQLLTLSSTVLQKLPQRQKRKRSLSDDSCLDEQTRSKRPQARPKRCEHSAEYLLGPVAHWAATRGRSRTFKDEDGRGSQANSKPAKEYVDVPLETFGSAIGELYLRETLSFLLQAEWRPLLQLPRRWSHPRPWSRLVLESFGGLEWRTSPTRYHVLGGTHLPKISTIWAEIPRSLSVKRSVRNRGGVRQWVALGPSPTIWGDSVERSKHALAEVEMTDKTESDEG